MEDLELMKRAAKDFAAANLRFTPNRKMILESLAASNVAVTPYQLKERLESEGRKVDAVSIYRTLEVLSQLRLVHRVGLVQGAYSVFRRGDHPSSETVFLVDTNDRTVVETALPPKVGRLLAKEITSTGADIVDIRIEAVVG